MLVTSSTNGGISLEVIPKFQLSDGPNPVATPINSALMVWLPDPDSAVGGSEFITSGGATFRIRIDEYIAEALQGTVYDEVHSSTDNVVFIALDPAVFVIGRGYRVVILDANDNVCDEWDFLTFSHDVAGSAPAGITAINDAIRRIAGLLGYRQRVTYSDYYLGVPREALIELLDDADATLAQYRRKVTLSSENVIIAETSAALDQNVL